MLPLSFFRPIPVNLRKIITSAGFWLCVGMTVLLLFSAEVYTDQVTHNRYSVFQALTNLSGEELASHHELCNKMVIRSARGGWFTLFAPIAAAFCFVPLLCTEREENAVRFQIFRTSKLRHSITEFFSGVFCGGLAITLGYMIFSAAIMFLFPSGSELKGFEAEMLQKTAFNFPKLVVEMLLYGVFWSIPSMFLTSVLRNKYLIMCIPFFVKYAFTQTVQKLSQNAFSDFDNIDEEMLRITSIIDPDGILWIMENTEFTAAALFFGAIAAVLFAAYILINQKRGDCGA